MDDEANEANEAKEPLKTGSAKRWHEMLADAEQAERNYHLTADRVDDRLCKVEDMAAIDPTAEMQVFWSNLEVLKPTLYSRAPKPAVDPRFGARDQLLRITCDVMDRALTSAIEQEDFHDVMKLVRDDLATNARGVAWVRLVEVGGVQRATVEHVSRKDFRHGPARKWKEVPWVARAAYLDRETYEARFGKPSKGAEFKRRDLTERDEEEGRTDEKQAKVWEIWHKARNVVVWVAEGAEETSDEREPLHSLDRFWPCPKPAFGTLKRETLTPLPDVLFYEDQLVEINELTDRIASLCDSLRLKGFYSAGGDLSSAIEVALSDLGKGALLVPVRSTSELGGSSLKDAIVWMPLEQVAITLRECVAQRRELIEVVYEVTGLSDIMRGATQASETLGAQQLKAQFGSVRVRERQEELQRVARDLLRIMAEIMAESFTAEELFTLAQVKDVPTSEAIAQQASQVTQAAQQQMMQLVEASAQAEAQGNAEAAQQADQQGQQIEAQAKQALEQLQQQVTIEKVMQLLQDEKLRPIAIEIETDSTITPDRQAEKQARSELVMSLGPLIQQGVQAMQLAPQLGPFVAETLRFVANGFDVPRSMEDAIDDLAEGFANYQPPQQQGGGEAEAAKAQALQAKAQADAEAKAMELKIKQQSAEIDQAKAQADIQAKQQEAEIDQATAAADIDAKRQEAAIDGQKAGYEMQLLQAKVEEAMARIAMIEKGPADNGS